MEQAGDCIESLPTREVYYLVRGRKKDKQKIALVHGSFFETIKISDLISQSFLQVLEDSIGDNIMKMTQESRDFLSSIFSEQKKISKVRNVEKASVKLRFRVMTEVKKESNLLNGKQYPDILDNTINFTIPLHDESEIENILQKAQSVFTAQQLSTMKKLKVKHHFNGYFFVFQVQI